MTWASVSLSNRIHLRVCVIVASERATDMQYMTQGRNRTWSLNFPKKDFLKVFVNFVFPLTEKKCLMNLYCD